ncbi:hypothetical protein F2P81_015815 [Scophthalmus maximus]|uniref:Uncharacterized protein n=1 Tax=Scophthalmus maximus TaxID=52904 RepID=A0A6A4SHA2_SCOMX|nr:hypothetical protein F2P81_015815 [Scophthalmus maximus]
MQSDNGDECDSVAVCVLDRGGGGRGRGDEEGEEEDHRRRQTGGEEEADLTGRAEETTGLIECWVVMETASEEVVAHHLDELGHLRPGGTERNERGKNNLFTLTLKPQLVASSGLSLYYTHNNKWQKIY